MRRDLVDTYLRKFVYLRLSVTDRCNFRCIYCLPFGYEASSDKNEELSLDETRRLVSAFAALGVTKVRITGGEPTVRRDIVELVETVSSIGGIKKVAMTTNGYRLKNLVHPLRKAGLTAVNISIDSLDSSRFKTITGTDRLSDVLAGAEEALGSGFESVKVNAVLLKDLSENEIHEFIRWIRHRPVSVRFIELMRTGKNKDFFNRHHISAGEIQFHLLKSGWRSVEKKMTDGPALVYRHPEYQGSIGVIAPYSPSFCESCNRLRVSSRGALRLCLFGEKDVSLRKYLSDDSSHDDLVMFIRSSVIEKPASHLLHEGKYGNTWNLAEIGG